MKLRNGFVSNSSSSSFVVALGKDGKFVSEADYGTVRGTVGVGYATGDLWNTDELEEMSYRPTDSDFQIVSLYYDGSDDSYAFVRPLSKMKKNATWEEFLHETKQLFEKKFGERAGKVGLPKLMVAGSIGNGG